METSVNIVLPELFPPVDYAGEAVAGLQLPLLERILARSGRQPLSAATLESWLCGAFGVAEGAIAPITLLADGIQPDGYFWMRADPVHLLVRGSEVLLGPVGALSGEESAQLCDSLNRHFEGEGMYFEAPHPQRWYLRLSAAPGVETHLLSEVVGQDIRPYLPHGQEALRWHRLFNEIQMLLAGHAANDVREQRGYWSVNSIWPWGGGFAPERLHVPCSQMLTDNALAAAFGVAANIPVHELADCREYLGPGRGGKLLIVWDGLRRARQQGDLAGWRDSLAQLEQTLAPLWHELRKGRIDELVLDVVQGAASCRFSLTPRGAWRFWRRRRLAQFAG